MKPIFASILGLAALMPSTAWAFDITPPDGGGGGGAEGLAAYVAQIIPVLQILFVGLATLMLVMYAGRMVIFSSQESTKSEAKMAYLYLIVGGVIVAAAGWVAQALTPGIAGVGGEVIQRSYIETPIQNAILYMKMVLAAGLMANIVIQAVRLINSDGDQAKVDRAKKRLINSFIGVGLVLIANSIVLSSNPSTLGDSSMSAGSADLNYIVSEIVGLSNFLITLIGAGVVIAIIIAGVLLVFSVNESLKEKVKHIILTSIFILVVLLISYALINFFLNAPLL